MQIQQLVPVAARTAKQLLKRLRAHYLGDPVGPGLPLRAVAEAMLKSPRDSKIIFLGQQKSFFVNHVILVDVDDERIADINTFVKVTWKYPHYTAMLLGGRTLNLVVTEQMSIEDFIEESELEHTFARRVPRDGVV